MDILRPTADAAIAAWAERVRKNTAELEQVLAAQPAPPPAAGVPRTGFAVLQPAAGSATAGPRVSAAPQPVAALVDDPAVNAVLSFARPDDCWLDIGAGSGRFALPLAGAVRQVIALEPAAGPLANLAHAAVERGLTNVQTIESAWPTAQAIQADVAFISQVGYTVVDIGPFLDAMERSASRLCLAHLQWQPPQGEADSLWPAIHGMERTPLPALPELITVLIARGKTVELRRLPGGVRNWPGLMQALGFVRQHLGVQPGSPKDQRLRELLRERLIERDGKVALNWTPRPAFLLSWRPSS